MNANGLSRNYAKAIFSQALEKWLSALEDVQSNLTPSLTDRLQDPQLSFSEKQADLNKIIPNDSDQYIKNFLYLMLKDGNIDMVGSVVQDLELLMQGGPNLRVAKVTTAFSLSDEEKQKFEQKLRAKHGQDLQFSFEVDSSILGGAVVQIGDKVIDGSLANKLGAMKNALNL